MHSDPLQKIEAYRRGKLPLTSSVPVVPNGYIVYESYHGNTGPQTRDGILSVTKSVASVLVGIALNNGDLVTLDQQLVEFLPENTTSGLNSSMKAIFGRLGINTLVWNTDPQGYTYAGYGLALSSQEMAKFGYLYLNEERWDGTQVVPSEWV